jgi:hypothetical protein
MVNIYVQMARICFFFKKTIKTEFKWQKSTFGAPNLLLEPEIYFICFLEMTIIISCGFTEVPAALLGQTDSAKRHDYSQKTRLNKINTTC